MGSKYRLMGGPREIDIQNAILLSLGDQDFEVKEDKNGVSRRRGLGVYRAEFRAFWRANSGVFRGASGQPVRANPSGTADIIGCVRGQMVALEVKTDTGKQSPEQVRWQAAFEGAGGKYRVVRSVSEALAFVKELEAA